MISSMKKSTGEQRDKGVRRVLGCQGTETELGSREGL